ncbi:MAG: ZPR1 zinc finger domain-containing protein [archaeon]
MPKKKESREEKKKPTKDTEEKGSDAPAMISGEPCPFCHQKTLTLMEAEVDVPYFGKTYIFSMDCSNCKYHKADVESADENREPVKFTLEISSEEDMKIRIIKSSNAMIKIPHIGNIEPGEASNGYITNVEGILQRMKKQIETLRDDAEEEDKKKAKNMLKKLMRVMWGQEKLKMILEDPTGNSAIISDKVVKSKL